jgi:hypothetical protein
VKRLVTIAAVLVTAAPALAGDGPVILGNAQKAIDDIDYEAARALTDQALESGELLPPELARAHLLAGEVAAALGDDAAAHDHFERFLLLAPDGQLPAGLSPKITQPFVAARASAVALGKATFDVELTRAPGKVAITIGGDPLHMAARVRVRLNGGSELQAIGARIELPADDKVAITASVAILDEHGNELAHRDGSAPVALESSTAAKAAGPTTRTEHRIPAVFRWPTWAAITVIAGGSCGYFSWQLGKDHDELDALNASSSMHTFDEAKAIDDRGQRDSLLTNVSLGVAIAAAAATVLTLTLDETHDVEVQPLAAPGTAGASATIRF